MPKICLKCATSTFYALLLRSSFLNTFLYATMSSAKVIVAGMVNDARGPAASCREAGLQIVKWQLAFTELSGPAGAQTHALQVA